MKIAVTAEQNHPESPIDPRFGRAKYFMVFDEATRRWEAVDNQHNLQAAQGAGIQSAATVVDAGCHVLISGHCGPKAFAALNAAGVAVYTAASGTVQDALAYLQSGRLRRIAAADVEGHW